MYIELEDIGLGYYSTGIEKKIHELISSSYKPKITYGKEERKKQFRTNSASLRAYWAGYGNTYTVKIPIKWEYKTSDLMKFFKNNSTVIFRRKEVEFDNQSYIQKIKDITKDTK
ncbi:MAG: hypothetical protein PHO27_07265 [Sulfuricurvum sp.]|nr:hypothetical protein [Sulfuricurvum sp.]